MKSKRLVPTIVAAIVIAATALAATGADAATPKPGTGGRARVVHFGSILPQVNETGFISLSQNAEGTNAASKTLTIVKPAGATVRKAYASAATTGFSNATIANGDIKIDGAGVNFTLSTPNAIGSNNYFGEVTSLVSSKLNSAPAGNVTFTVAEAFPSSVDGVILSVIFNDPNQTSSNTIVLLFGAQNIAGDDFNIGLANPINKSDPNLKLDMALGISFGFQDFATQQFSTVDVNGSRLTSAAGGEDDGEADNGALITVGGVGDSNANPANPNATPTEPRSDDELYSLLPFVDTGDTSIAVHTQNPSNDDNIFFSSLVLNSTTAVVGEGIVLAPPNATNFINTNHTVTATVQNDQGQPIVNRTVTFKVISGPNNGLTATANTNAQGKATFTFSSSVVGVDEVQASFMNSAGSPVLSNVARKEWIKQGGDVTKPTCLLDHVTNTVPKQLFVKVQDTGSGLNTIVASKLVNSTVNIPAFPIGDQGLKTVVATKTNQSLPSQLELTVKDVAGNTTVCDPVDVTVNAGSSAVANSVPGNEHVVTITNGSPGLRTIVLAVNGQVRFVRLHGATTTVDIGNALNAGDDNTVWLFGLGRQGGSANVLIWDGNGNV